MDAPASSSYHRHLESSSTTMRASPPGSAGGSPQGMVPPPNPFAVVAPTRNHGLTAPLSQALGSRSPGRYNSASYSHSTSPSTASNGVPEMQPNDSPGLGISPTQTSSSNLNAQKRAYRQRRKDPSCDACRERKVKCDATETTACSECSSRNHKCQFTKETNRRMSSIKQVQDLQNQIAELQDMNSRLRMKIAESDNMDLDREPKSNYNSDRRKSPPTAPKKVRVPVMSHFDHVRRNIQVHSSGIFEHPLHHRRIPTEPALGFPEIPPRANFAYISRAYLDSMHDAFPVLHWPTFHAEANQVYTAKSFDGISREWIGLFFAVLACGCLHLPSGSTVAPRNPSDGPKFYEVATRMAIPWPDHVTTTQATLQLLLSHFSTESKMGSAGARWLACAVKTAQGLGLNSETGAWPPLETEIRRRLWWAIYVRDRITSLESNCPMSINDVDCDIPLPSSVEDRYIQSPGHLRARPTAIQSTGFVAVVQVTQSFSALYQTLKSSVIPAQELLLQDEKLGSILSLLPESYRSNSGAPLETAALSPILTLQFGRFQLYRRNVSPVCRPAERTEAIDRCTSVGEDTARYIARTLHSQSASPESEKSWQTRVVLLASNMICLHLWRCMLMLCFRAEYDAAIVCMRLAAAIGDMRKVNTACGKNLVFFLGQLIGRVRSGHGDPQRLDQDEEMLAYVSGDMQSSLEQSWVWAGTDVSSPANVPHTAPHFGTHTYGPDDPMRGTLPLRPNPGSPEHMAREWEGWDKVEHLIRQLMEEQRPRMAQGPASSYYPPPHNPVKRVQLAPDAPPVSPPTENTTLPTSRGRISIASII